MQTNSAQRPDLAAPIWDVKVYHKDLVSPGYWFVAPYKALDQDQADRSWVGPHIYDGLTGELVWSGSLSFEFSRGNVEDFRVSNVNGDYQMTLMSQALGKGVILDSSYQIVDKVQIDDQHGINTHEFNFIENGTRALVIKTRKGDASKEESEKVGFDGECHCSYDGFEERDTATWESTFRFRSEGVIGLDESTLTYGSIQNKCNGRWDFMCVVLTVQQLKQLTDIGAVIRIQSIRIPRAIITGRHDTQIPSTRYPARRRKLSGAWVARSRTFQSTSPGNSRDNTTSDFVARTILTSYSRCWITPRVLTRNHPRTRSPAACFWQWMRRTRR